MGNQFILTHGLALDARVRHALAVQIDGSCRIVVAWNHVVDIARVTIAVHDANDRNGQSTRLADRDGLLAYVHDEDHVGDSRHVLDARKGLVIFLAQATHAGEFFLRVLRSLFLIRLNGQQVLVSINGFLNGLPVGQHAAQPTVVHVILTTAFGLAPDDVRRLALGPHEEHAAPVGDRLPDVVQARHKIGQSLIKIQNMGAVASPKDVGAHERIPAMGLVAEMGAGFQQGPDAQVGLLEDRGCGFFARRGGSGSGGITGRRGWHRRFAHSFLLRGSASASYP